MVQHHGWDLEGWENLILWERDIYITYLEELLNKDKKQVPLSKEEMALIKQTGKSNQAALKGMKIG